MQPEVKKFICEHPTYIKDGMLRHMCLCWLSWVPVLHSNRKDGK